MKIDLGDSIECEVRLIHNEQTMELTDFFGDFCENIQINKEQALKLAEFIHKAFNDEIQE